MSKFKFICEDEAIPFGGASKTIQEFETDELFNILNNMSLFLQKSGYLSKNQKLELGRDIHLNLNEDEFDLDLYTNQLFTGVGVGGSSTIGNPGAFSGMINEGGSIDITSSISAPTTWIYDELGQDTKLTKESGHSKHYYDKDRNK
jgi:hypothetical protein